MFIVSKFSDNTESLEGIFKTSICGGNGIFEKQKSWLGESTRKVSDYEFFNYPEIEENFKFIFEENSDVTFPKIPATAILYVLKWYQDITKETGKEAQINFYRTKGKTSIKIKDKEIAIKDIPTVKFWSDEVFSYVPKQKNSMAETSVDSDEYYEELNKQVGCYVETHSHNSMSAFRSGTDEAYSYNDGIQLVFGKFNTQKIEMFSWATIQGKQKAGLTFEELGHFIEFPECTFSDKDKKVLFNENLFKNIEDEVFEVWNSQIVVIKPRVTNGYEGYYQGNYGNQLSFGNYYYEETKRVYNSEHIPSSKSFVDDFDEKVDFVTDVFAEDIESIVQRYIKKKNSKKAEELTDELFSLIEMVALYLTK